MVISLVVKVYSVVENKRKLWFYYIIIPSPSKKKVSNLLAQFIFHITVLQVSVDVDGKNGWKECFTVHGIRLPVGYYFGVSAATGELAGIF